MEYKDFIESKSKKMEAVGFSSIGINPMLFDFQRAIVDWACKRGRAAIFAELARVVQPGGAVYAAEIVLRQPLAPEVVAKETNWFA